MEVPNLSSAVLYSRLLGIHHPWIVTWVRQDVGNKEVRVGVEYQDNGRGIPCPECGAASPIHDQRVREIRHLDTCNFKTILEVKTPRGKCAEHGVWQAGLPFAEKSSRYTNLFEAVVIDFLKEASITAVADMFDLGWDAVDGIMQRAIERGLSRRKVEEIKELGIDETSYQKGHNYVTVILDKGRDRVVAVLDDRKAETLDRWFKEQKSSDLRGLESISMDMWDPFIKAVKENVEGAEGKIAFDRFHVSKHLNEAVDKVRRREYREYEKLRGENPLSKTRFQWLTNSTRTDNRSSKRRAFLELTRLDLLTAKAWRIKELVSKLWDYVYQGVAKEAWKKALWWISHCRIPEMIAVGKMIRNYLWGILNAVKFQTTNSMLEAKNNCIQRIKRMACGFRNKVRFKRAILFHLGGLDLYPSTI